MRRIELEISATPDCHFLEKRRLQRPVHPGGATPVRRTRIPIGMRNTGAEVPKRGNPANGRSEVRYSATRRRDRYVEYRFLPSVG